MSVAAASVVDYAKIRDQNIARNEQFLQALGLESRLDGESKPLVTISKGKRRLSEPSTAYNGTRRSDRVKGIIVGSPSEKMPSSPRHQGIKAQLPFEVEVNAGEDSDERRTVTLAACRALMSTAHDDLVEDTDITYCIMRLKTMGPSQLATRLKQIGRHAATSEQSYKKLVVFYYGLTAAGLTELALAARQIMDAADKLY